MPTKVHLETVAGAKNGPPENEDEGYEFHLTLFLASAQGKKGLRHGIPDDDLHLLCRLAEYSRARRSWVNLYTFERV